jgi:diacylglycerol kinase family enzyme
VRALLIVNPRATSTTGLRRDVIARALSSAVDLTVSETRYRGHATQLARAAVADGLGLVLTLGGDGTANEAINGIMDAGLAAGRDKADSLPALAPLPGGSANVFTRALGLPTDPVDAAGQVLRSLATGQERSVGLGLARGRYFAFNAGLGLDAEVVRAVEAQRALGRPATPWLYMRSAVRQFYQVTDRRHPALTLERDGHPPEGPVFLVVVSNTAPWTYVGRRPVHTSPRASFETGLDVIALRKLRTSGMIRAAGQMLSKDGSRPLHGRHLISLHDESGVRVVADRPVAFQVDGEYMGEHESVLFESIPEAIRVIF